MAIGFARVEIVSAGGGSSAVGLSAYITRTIREDLATGESYNFARKAGDIVHYAVLLPPGAPDRLRTGERLWNEATARELTTDRKSGEVRFKKNAQIAKHVVIALPKELAEAEMVALATRFARESFSDQGVAVELVIHKPEGGSENWHAHLLVSTRGLSAAGFGTKARHLNPGFATNSAGQRFINEQDHWEQQWTGCQNRYFAELGISLTVDAMGNHRQQHLGPTWHLQDAEKKAVNAGIAEEARAAARDPDQVLEALTRRQATFGRRDVERWLSRHGIAGAERDQIVAAVLGQDTVLALYERGSGRESGRFTTRGVRDQEQRVMGRVAALRAHRHAVDTAAIGAAVAARRLDEEQRGAVLHACRAEGLAVIEGRAGSGKSYTMAAVRDAHERSGYRVVGLAPTNTVARDMARDGFRSASTVHLAMIDLERGRQVWDGRTVVLLDEAAMLDSRMYDRLSEQAERAGAKLILVGDDRQLGSVERGGLFSQIRDQAGSAELRQVRRQAVDWQKLASQDFAAGAIAAGLRAYQERGFVQWRERTAEARAALVADWGQAAAERPEAVRFVYASTNQAVEGLNAELRALRQARGELGPGRRLETVRGAIELAAGDRLQFYGNDRRAGIYNGVVGTVAGIEGSRVVVDCDNGQRVDFDSGTFRAFGHGYAGTVYRGQGKTQLEVFALYDHPAGWNCRTAYVGMTRHQATVSLYVGRDLARDEEALAKALGRAVDDGASLRYATAAERQKASLGLRERLGGVSERLQEGPDPIAQGRQKAEATRRAAGFDRLRQRLAAREAAATGETQWLVAPFQDPLGRDSLGRGLDAESVARAAAEAIGTVQGDGNDSFHEFTHREACLQGVDFACVPEKHLFVATSEYEGRTMPDQPICLTTNPEKSSPDNQSGNQACRE